MESWFSSAEVLLRVPGRQKQTFHSGEIKLELKKSKYLNLEFTNQFYKMCRPAVLAFPPLWEARKHP